jgi:hypothetical protein
MCLVSFHAFPWWRYSTARLPSLPQWTNRGFHFWGSLTGRDLLNQTVLYGRKYIFETRWKSVPCARKFYSNIFNRFVTMSKNVTRYMDFLPIFRCFLLVVTWFLDLFKIADLAPKLYARTHLRAKFHAYRPGISKRSFGWRKKKKKKTN